MKNILSLVVGKKGTGKTTLCRDLIKKFKGKVFVVDYLGEYRDLASDRVFVSVWTGYNSFYQLTRRAWEAPGKKLLVLDEVEFLALDNAQKEIIDFLYRLGRHKSLDIISVSHRFYMIPVIIRAMTDIFYVFRLSEPRDLAFLQGIMSSAEIESIKSLKVGEYKKIII